MFNVEDDTVLDCTTFRCYWTIFLLITCFIGLSYNKSKGVSENTPKWHTKPLLHNWEGKKKSLQPQHFSHPCTHEQTLGSICSHTHAHTHSLTHWHSQSEFCLPHWGCEGDVSVALHAPSLFLSHWRHVQRQHTLAPSSTTFPGSHPQPLSLHSPQHHHPDHSSPTDCLSLTIYLLSARCSRAHTYTHVRTHKSNQMPFATHVAINSESPSSLSLGYTRVVLTDRLSGLWWRERCISQIGRPWRHLQLRLLRLSKRFNLVDLCLLFFFVQPCMWSTSVTNHSLRACRKTLPKGSGNLYSPLYRCGAK